jgi:hypothetical protein
MIALPPTAPVPRGSSAPTNVSCASDHAGNKVMHHKNTDILMYLNSALIQWYIMAQNTVESSTFGSVFIAMRIGIGMIEAMRYKLRMLVAQ